MKPRLHTDAGTVGDWLDAMATAVTSRYGERGIDEYTLIGVHTGGVWVGRALAARLGLGDDIGELNIAFYRDDFSRIGMSPVVQPSRLQSDVDDRHVLLVDDILYTGRTVRAALNEIFDWGRPASVTLAVLVDRGGRELPIEAAIVGQRLDLADDEHVKLSAPEPMELTVHRRG